MREPDSQRIIEEESENGGDDEDENKEEEDEDDEQPSLVMQIFEVEEPATKKRDGKQRVKHDLTKLRLQKTRSVLSLSANSQASFLFSTRSTSHLVPHEQGA